MKNQNELFELATEIRRAFCEENYVKYSNGLSMLENMAHWLVKVPKPEAPGRFFVARQGRGIEMVGVFWRFDELAIRVFGGWTVPYDYFELDHATWWAWPSLEAGGES